MKRFLTARSTAWVIWFLPFVYLAFYYSSLSETVPTHYAGDKPDSYSSRIGFVFIQLLMMAIGAGVYGLFRNLKKIDPERNAAYSETPMQIIGTAALTFVAALSIWITYTTVQYCLTHPILNSQHQ